MDDNHACSQFDVDVEVDFELAQERATVWVGDEQDKDGYFVDQSWVGCIQAKEDRPAVLHTFLRHPSSGYSFAHDCHPFVAMVHLLTRAQIGSDVFLSIPYLSDVTAVDQLCHHADPQHKNLHIYILLGPHPNSITCLETFVGRSPARETAVGHLHIKQNGTNSASFSHSRVMVSSAGVMLGSYDGTNASRLRHYEHGILLGPDFDGSGLQAELEHLWQQAIGPALHIIARAPSLTKFLPPPKDRVYNPYKANENLNKKPKTK